MKKVLLAGRVEATGNYQAALRAAGMEPVPLLEAADCSEFDGLLLPGGADIDPELFGQENHGSRTIDRALDERQLALLRLFLKAEKPVLGICKGMQLLNIALGGDIVQNIPSFARHQWIEKDQAHLSRCIGPSFLSRLYSAEFFTNSAHHQAVARLGDGLRIVQESDDGVPEAIVHEHLPYAGLQWHPERMCCANARSDTVDGLPVFENFRAVLEGTASFQA